MAPIPADPFPDLVCGKEKGFGRRKTQTAADAKESSVPFPPAAKALGKNKWI